MKGTIMPLSFRYSETSSASLLVVVSTRALSLLFLQKINQVIYMSATPGDWEVLSSKGIIVEQLVRRTGRLDPVVEVRPTRYQLEDLI